MTIHFNRFLDVPAGRDVPNLVNMIVEIPKGRRSKFEVDKEYGLLRLDRYLYSSLHYPGDYGFIPQTLAEDGDPLDILVIVNEPTFSGCLIEARPIGLFKMTDKGMNDYKVLAVPASDPTFSDFHDLWRVPAHFLREVEHFFATYKELEGDFGEDVVQTQGWDDTARALREIQSCVERYNDSLPVRKKKSSRKRSSKAAEGESSVIKQASQPGTRRSAPKKSAKPRTSKKKTVKKAAKKAAKKTATKKTTRKKTTKKA